MYLFKRKKGHGLSKLCQYLDQIHKNDSLLLGVQEVLEEGLLAPGNTLVLVGLGVRETGSLTRLTAKDTVQVRTDLVGTTSFGGVALGTTSLEELSSGGGVSCGHGHVG
jgi:hypothetical protein